MCSSESRISTSDSQSAGLSRVQFDRDVPLTSKCSTSTSDQLLNQLLGGYVERITENRVGAGGGPACTRTTPRMIVERADDRQAMRGDGGNSIFRRAKNELLAAPRRRGREHRPASTDDHCQAGRESAARASHRLSTHRSSHDDRALYSTEHLSDRASNDCFTRRQAPHQSIHF